MIAAPRMRERLAAGRTVAGPIVNFNSPWFVDICAAVGFDFVIVDCEHGPMSPGEIEPMLRAAEAGGISALVRVPANDPSLILRFLDIGAAGIMVPHIDRQSDASIAVKAARYPPMGERGIAGTTRAAGYTLGLPLADYAAKANDGILVMAMVETSAAVDNVEEIAATPGVDIIALGPNDLAASMGLIGQVTHPDVNASMDRVIATAKANGRWVSTTANTPEQARAAVARGVNILIASPAVLLAQSAKSLLDAVER
jgi:4-hydroxy-2-oxoheptanedioate aldolase